MSEHKTEKSHHIIFLEETDETKSGYWQIAPVDNERVKNAKYRVDITITGKLLFVDLSLRPVEFLYTWLSDTPIRIDYAMNHVKEMHGYGLPKPLPLGAIHDANIAITGNYSHSIPLNDLWINEDDNKS